MTEPHIRPGTAVARAVAERLQGGTKIEELAKARAAFGGVSRADSLETEGGICLAISGAKGAGKTLLASTAADSEYVKSRAGDPSCPVLYLDVEGGMRTVRHRHDVEFREITRWKDYEGAVDRLIAMPELPWGCVVVDNTTELAELCLAHQLGPKKDPEWTEYRRLTQDMTVQVRKLRDLARTRGIVVIFNVWDFEQRDDSGNIRKISLDMTPRLLGRFSGAVDMIGWLEVLDDGPPGTRVLHLEGNNKVTAKFRRAPVGPEADIPYDLFWRNPEVPENSPLVSLLGTLLGGDNWPKDRHLAPTGVKAGVIRRPVPEPRAN